MPNYTTINFFIERKLGRNMLVMVMVILNKSLIKRDEQNTIEMNEVGYVLCAESNSPPLVVRYDTNSIYKYIITLICVVIGRCI